MNEQNLVTFYYFVICVTGNKRTNPKYFLFHNEGSIYEITKVEEMARADIEKIRTVLSKQDKKEYIAYVDHIGEYAYKVLKKYFPLCKIEDYT